MKIFVGTILYFLNYESDVNHMKNNRIFIDGYEIILKEVIEIKSLDNFINFIKKTEKVKYYYRGVTKYEQIHSTLLRDCITGNDKDGFDSVEIKENELIRKFEDNASIWMKDYNNPVDLIATAQHLGLRTRYKDWSLSILIATLFSLHNSGYNKYYVLFNKNIQFVQVKTMPYNNKLVMSKNNVKYKSQKFYYKRICIARTKLWNNSKILQLIKERRSHKNTDAIEVFYKKIRDLDKINSEIIFNYFKVTFIHTNSKMGGYFDLICQYTIYYIMAEKLLIEAKISNDRILNQKGLFEYDDYDIFYSTKPRKELIKLYKEKSFYGILIIDKKVRDDLINFISKLGITYIDIMKDASSTAKYINNVYYDKKSPKTDAV